MDYNVDFQHMKIKLHIAHKAQTSTNKVAVERSPRSQVFTGCKLQLMEDYFLLPLNTSVSVYPESFFWSVRCRHLRATVHLSLRIQGGTGESGFLNLIHYFSFNTHCATDSWVFAVAVGLLVGGRIWQTPINTVSLAGF